jgi:hypothetical protein
LIIGRDITGLNAFGGCIESHSERSRGIPL